MDFGEFIQEKRMDFCPNFHSSLSCSYTSLWRRAVGGCKGNPKSAFILHPQSRIAEHIFWTPFGSASFSALPALSMFLPIIFHFCSFSVCFLLFYVSDWCRLSSFSNPFSCSNLSRFTFCFSHLACPLATSPAERIAPNWGCNAWLSSIRIPSASFRHRLCLFIC